MFREISCFCKENIWDKGKICSCCPTFPVRKHSFEVQNNTFNTPAKRKKNIYKDVHGSSSSDENNDNFSLQDFTDDESLDVQNLLVNDEMIEMVEPEVSKISQGTQVFVQFLGG